MEPDQDAENVEQQVAECDLDAVSVPVFSDPGNAASNPPANGLPVANARLIRHLWVNAAHLLGGGGGVNS